MNCVLAPSVCDADKLVRAEDVASRLALRDLFSVKDDEHEPRAVEGVCQEYPPLAAIWLSTAPR